MFIVLCIAAIAFILRKFFIWNR